MCRLPVPGFGIAAGPGESLRFEFDRVHHGVRTSIRDRQRKCAGSGAQIEHDGVSSVVLFEKCQCPSEEQFGLRSRDEHTGADSKIYRAHRRRPGDVLEGDPFCPLRDHCPIRVDHRGVDERHQTEASAFDSEEVSGEQLGVHTGTRDTRFF